MSLANREIIIRTIKLLAVNFFDYDLVCSGNLGCGEIEKVIDLEEITVDEIVSTFRSELERMLLERKAFEQMKKEQNKREAFDAKCEIIYRSKCEKDEEARRLRKKHEQFDA